MTFQDLGINVTDREQGKTNCPNCERLGKRKEPSLSFNKKDGLYNCHKCGWSGKLKENKVQVKINTQNMTALSDDGLRYLTGRGISQEVIKANRIGMNGKLIQFPYFFEGELVNYKLRGINDKTFRQAVGGMQVMYNYDRLKGSKDLYVVEGEIDALTLEMVGIVATSVSQGAPNENDKSVDKKLECMTNCMDLFEEAETVWICVDSDANGKRLRDEIIRRVGAEKCKIVDWGDHKDANKTLLLEGKEGVLNCLKDAKDCQIEGVFVIEEILDDMLHYYRQGEDTGDTTHYPDFNKCFTWKSGEVTMWTGYMNEGKSLFLKSLALLKAIKDDWKIAVFSPEEYPARFFFNDLIQTLVGKTMDKRYNNYMSEEEYLEAANLISKHFYYLYPPKKFTIDSINKDFSFLVKKKGVNMIIADPFNKFYHNRGNAMRDEYIGEFMTKVERFAKEHNVCYNLVAHQSTPEIVSGSDYPKPDAYKIKGGGTFADMTDNIISVWRPYRKSDYKNTTVMVESQKIKKQKLVGIPGEVIFNFDFASNRYLINGWSPFNYVEPQKLEVNETFLTNFNEDDMPF